MLSIIDLSFTITTSLGNKKKPKVNKLEQTREKRGAGLARIGYDPKSVEIFGRIVE